MSLTDPKPESVAAIVRDAGGEIVGWHRLHGTAYLLEAAGLGGGFYFLCNGSGPQPPPWRQRQGRRASGKTEGNGVRGGLGGHIFGIRGRGSAGRKRSAREAGTCLSGRQGEFPRARACGNRCLPVAGRMPQSVGGNGTENARNSRTGTSEKGSGTAPSTEENRYA